MKNNQDERMTWLDAGILLCCLIASLTWAGVLAYMLYNFFKLLSFIFGE